MNFLQGLYDFFSDLRKPKRIIIMILILSVYIFLSSEFLSKTTLFTPFDLLFVPLSFISLFIDKFIPQPFLQLFLIILGFLPFIIRLTKRKERTITYKDYAFYFVLSGLISYTLLNFVHPGNVNYATIGHWSRLDERSKTMFLRIYQTNLLYLIGSLILLRLFIGLYQHTKNNNYSLFQVSGLLIVITKVLFIIQSILIYLIYPNQVYQELFVNHTDMNVIVLFERLLSFTLTYIIWFMVIKVFKQLISLLTNFTHDNLFDEENVGLLKTISDSLFVIVIITLTQQFVINLYKLVMVKHYSNVQFSFELNIKTIMIALSFYLLSLIMRKAYEIYTDNQLTI